MANVQSMSISREISAKDQHFADIYIGGSNQVRGSAKACYKHLHPRCKDSTAATEGPAIRMALDPLPNETHTAGKGKQE